MPDHPRMEFDPPIKNSSSYAYYLNSVGPTLPVEDPLVAVPAPPEFPLGPTLHQRRILK